MNLSSRLGRRPWKVDEGFDELKTVKRVRNLSGNEMRSLLRVINETMDGTHKSIALANLRKATKKSVNMLLMGGKVKNPMLADKDLKREVIQKLKRWIKWWETRGSVTIVLRMTIVASATPSILSMMNNTTKNAKIPISNQD